MGRTPARPRSPRHPQHSCRCSRGASAQVSTGHHPKSSLNPDNGYRLPSPDASLIPTCCTPATVPTPQVVDLMRHTQRSCHGEPCSRGRWHGVCMRVWSSSADGRTGERDGGVRGWPQFLSPDSQRSAGPVRTASQSDPSAKLAHKRAPPASANRTARTTGEPRAWSSANGSREVAGPFESARRFDRA
jgi:hypothetical protein